MKNLNAKYKYGHLWDKTTGKRIILKDNSEILIAGDNNCFEIQDLNNHPIIPLSKSKILEKVKLTDNLSKYQIILDRGSILYFEIKVTLKKEDMERIECVFEVELLEDLYIFTKTTWKNTLPNLFDCACAVRSEVTNRLEFFEPIFAYSLNNAYEKTYTHYFANQGSSTCNAFDRFYSKTNSQKLFLKNRREYNNQNQLLI